MPHQSRKPKSPLRAFTCGESVIRQGGEETPKGGALVSAFCMRRSVQYVLRAI